MNLRPVLTPQRLAWIFFPLLLGAVVWTAQRGPRQGRMPIYGLEPGARAHVHADITDCHSCHETQRQVTPGKCLACHGDIAARLQASSGFHTRAQSLGLLCTSCHREHRGADFDLAAWSTVTTDGQFDHAQIGFALRGKHAPVPCKSCHPQSPQHFAPPPNTCAAAACHGKRDPHRGALGGRCESCHSETGAWPTPHFDHNDPQVPGRFRLLGKHLQAACAACHKKNTLAAAPRFVPTPTACRSCHRSDDPHRGRRPLCGSCHQPTGWK